jgi:hypothetical protein
MADARRRAWWAVAGAAALPAAHLLRKQWRGLREAFDDAEDPYGDRFVTGPAPEQPTDRPAPATGRRPGRLVAAIAAQG